MKFKGSIRFFMLLTGILAALVIMLSPSVSGVDLCVKEKLKTEKQANTDAKVSVAPADAVTSPVAVQIDEHSPSLLQQIFQAENAEDTPVVDLNEFVPYLKVLFRTLIAPNAP